MMEHNGVIMKPIHMGSKLKFIWDLYTTSVKCRYATCNQQKTSFFFRRGTESTYLTALKVPDCKAPWEKKKKGFWNQTWGWVQKADPLTALHHSAWGWGSSALPALTQNTVSLAPVCADRYSGRERPAAELAPISWVFTPQLSLCYWWAITVHSEWAITAAIVSDNAHCCGFSIALMCVASLDRREANAHRLVHLWPNKTFLLISGLPVNWGPTPEIEDPFYHH